MSTSNDIYNGIRKLFGHLSKNHKPSLEGIKSKTFISLMIQSLLCFRDVRIKAKKVNLMLTHLPIFLKKGGPRIVSAVALNCLKYFEADIKEAMLYVEYHYADEQKYSGYIRLRVIKIDQDKNMLE